MVEHIDPMPGEVQERTYQQDWESNSDEQKWDELQRTKALRRELSERVAGMESQLLQQLHKEHATIKSVPLRGDIIIDKGTPQYDGKTISVLYDMLGKDVCDEGTRKLINKKVTTTERVDGVRVNQLLKRGDDVRVVVEESLSKVIQKPPRIKLQERRKHDNIT